MGELGPTRVEAVVDLAAIRHNVTRMRERAGRPVMVVVKADAYGHGLVPVATAAREAGAEWLGTAVLDEALALRAAGDVGPLLFWLTVPGEDYAAAIHGHVDIGVHSRRALAEVVDAAQSVRRRARVHLKCDTGMGRGGATAQDWPALVDAALRAADAGDVEVIGVWSHLACADHPEDPSVAEQVRAFERFVQTARSAGLSPPVRHLANSAGAIGVDAARFDLVRVGLATYGLSPMPDTATPADLGLRPAMTLRAVVSAVKRVGPRQGVSYGLTYRTGGPTTLAVVPVGYADGVLRGLSNRGQVWLCGRRRTIAGIVSMDQFVVDVGDDPVAPGDEVLLFGPGTRGEPGAQDWAEAAGTINYEVVSRLGGRVRRRYVDSAHAPAATARADSSGEEGAQP